MALDVYFLSCVGEQDPLSPVTNQEGSLLTSFGHLSEEKKIRFRGVFLLPSSKEESPNRHTEEHATKCAEQVAERFGVAAQIVPLELRNPADLREVFVEMRRVLQEAVFPSLQERRSDQAHFHINISSGTTQMKESWPFLVRSGLFHPHGVTMWQVMDPRGGYKTRGQRVRRGAELDLLIQHSILDRAERLVPCHLYASLVQELELLSGPWEYFTLQVCGMLANYDSAEYGDARKQITDLLKDGGGRLEELPADWRKLLDEQAEELAKLANDSHSEHKRSYVTALYHRASRQVRAGDYGDALITAHTACEVALNNKLEQLGVDWGNAAGAEDEGGYWKKLQFLWSRDSDFKAITVVSASSRHFLKKELERLNVKRNKRLHRWCVVTADDAERALLAAKTMLAYCTSTDVSEIEDNPFNADRVEALLSGLLDRSRKQLWES